MQIDKKIITQVAEGDVEAEGKSLIKHWCKYSTVTKNVTVSKVFQVTNNMNVTQNVTRNVTEAMEMKVPKTKCKLVYSMGCIPDYWYSITDLSNKSAVFNDFPADKLF